MSSKAPELPAEKPKADSPSAIPSVDSHMDGSPQQSSLVEYGPLPRERGQVMDRSIDQGGNGPQNMNVSGVMSRASSAEDSGLSLSTPGQVVPETTTLHGSSRGPFRLNPTKRRFVLSTETGGCHEWMEHPETTVSGVMSRASSAEDSGLSQPTPGHAAPETTTPNGSSSGPFRLNPAKRRFVLNTETDGCHEWVVHPDTTSTSTSAPQQAPRRSVKDKTALIQKYQNRVFNNYGFTERQVMILLRQLEQMALRVQKMVTLPNHLQFARKWDHMLAQVAAMNKTRSLESSDQTLSTNAQSLVEESCSTSKKRRIDQDYPAAGPSEESNVASQEGSSNSDQDAYESGKTLTCLHCEHKQTVDTADIFTARVRKGTSIPTVFIEVKCYFCSRCKYQQQVRFSIRDDLEEYVPDPSEDISRRLNPPDVLQPRDSIGQERLFHEKLQICTHCKLEQAVDIAGIFAERVRKGYYCVPEFEDVECYYSICGMQQTICSSIQDAPEQSTSTSSDHASGQSGDVISTQDVLQHGSNSNGQERSHQKELITGDNQSGIGNEQRSSLSAEQQQAVQATSPENNSLEVYIKNTLKLQQHHLRFIHNALRDYPSLARQQDLDDVAQLGNADQVWQACFDRNQQLLHAVDRALERAGFCNRQNPQTPDLIASFKRTLARISRQLERVVQASKYLRR